MTLSREDQAALLDALTSRGLIRPGDGYLFDDGRLVVFHYGAPPEGPMTAPRSEQINRRSK
jgi:hypothetical protein